MKIKKGFIKNNWPMMLLILIGIALAIRPWNAWFAVATIIIIGSCIHKYIRYDEIEQEANDWWREMSKDDKIKIKDKGV